MLEPCQGAGDTDFLPSSWAARQVGGQSRGHEAGGQGLAPRDGTCVGQLQVMGVSVLPPPPQ